VPDEDVVFDDNAFTDEGMTGYLAAFANRSILLDFYECTNLSFVSDFAAI
jgi:hypothetical protein